MATGKRKTKRDGFKCNYDYLEEYFELIYKRACLYAVKKIDRIINGSSSLYADDVRDFYLKLGLKNRKDAPRKLEEMKCEYRKMHQEFRTKVETATVTLHLEKIAITNRLCDFERDVLAMAMALVSDQRFRILSDSLNLNTSDKAWEVKYYLNILTDSFEERVRSRRYFMMNGNLNSKGLLQLDYSGSNAGTENDFQDMSILLPRRISSAIYGEESPEDMILAFSKIVKSEISIDQVVLKDELKKEVVSLVKNRQMFMKRRVEWGIENVLSYGMGTIILFSGIPGTGKTMLAYALANHAGLKLLQVNVPNLMEEFHNFEENFRMLLREAALQNAILFFDEADELFSDRGMNLNMPTILREFENFDGIAILATNRKQILDEALDRRILYKLDFEVPTPEMREKIWREHLPEKLPVSDDINLTELAERYEFSGGYIKNAVLLATQKAIARTGKKARIYQDDLRWAARKQRDSQLERFADKITPKFGLERIIVPDRLKAILEQLIREYRNRSKIYDQWNFKETISYGRAVTALFHGDPGVGKTMAAEAVAHELGLNLYPVKIPAIVSCYVGETAKNLERVFREAREAEAVLLFDEAEALFSSRLENGSHHAVYINQGIDTLLQEIEKFDGVVILTSNLPDRLDRAFMRRIRHHLHFSLPSSKARADIWRSHFPEAAPLAADIDFDRLGKDYELTGGIIRNIAIKAAFEAAAGNNKITMKAIQWLVEEELDSGSTGKKKNPVGFGAVA